MYIRCNFVAHPYLAAAVVFPFAMASMNRLLACTWDMLSAPSIILWREQSSADKFSGKDKTDSILLHAFIKHREEHALGVVKYTSHSEGIFTTNISHFLTFKIGDAKDQAGLHPPQDISSHNNGSRKERQLWLQHLPANLRVANKKDGKIIVF